jgi:hypothetical protein
MAGLVPAIHVFEAMRKQDVDARDKPGHDGEIRDALSASLRAKRSNPCHGVGIVVREQASKRLSESLFFGFGGI